MIYDIIMGHDDQFKTFKDGFSNDYQTIMVRRTFVKRTDVPDKDKSIEELTGIYDSYSNGRLFIREEELELTY